jgi:hypothetical protein
VVLTKPQLRAASLLTPFRLLDLECAFR